MATFLNYVSMMILYALSVTSAASFYSLCSWLFVEISWHLAVGISLLMQASGAVPSELIEFW